MKLSTTWSCPECGEKVRIHLDALHGSNDNRISVRVRVPETALADAFAHAWTHIDEETS